MPKTLFTRTLTVEITDAHDDPDTQLTEALQIFAERSDSSQDFTFAITDMSELTTQEILTDEEREAASEEGQKLRARNIKLLELKGWLFGENEKKNAGLPSEWDQEFWGRSTDCGTTCCIAGKTVLEAGGTFTMGNTFKLRNGDPVTNFEYARMPDGEVVHVADHAREILGLDFEQKQALFAGANGYHQAAAIIDAIVSGVEGNDIWGVRSGV